MVLLIILLYLFYFVWGRNKISLLIVITLILSLPRLTSATKRSREEQQKIMETTMDGY